MYLAIEWTSATFHAWRIAGGGTVLGERKSATGVNTIRDGAFDAALRRELGDWLIGADRVVLAGMITSRNGWVESPYAQVPAGPAEIAAGAVHWQLEGLPPLVFLPGVAQSGASPDVMRGEEIAILGAGLDQGIVVLPGAHSKWVTLAGGAIAGISTYLTGELIRLLLQDSIVAKLVPARNESNDDAFDQGVQASAHPLGALFSARSLVLFDRLKPGHIRSYVEGLLIGAELREAGRIGVLATGDIGLLGEAGLVGKYQRAIALLGRTSTSIDRNSVTGFNRIVGSLGSSG